MTKTIISYNKIPVTFHDRIYNHKYNKDVCPLCLKKLQDKDEVYLIINNYTFFPNIFVHKACVGSKRKCIAYLITSYRNAKKIIKKYSFWFENENENEVP